MSLSETKVIDQISVTDENVVLVRETTKILKDDVIVSESYHRWLLKPGDDVTDMPEKVKKICNLVWDKL